MVPNIAIVASENWKADFLAFISERMDQIDGDPQMVSMDDISKSLFSNRSDIMGQMALTLIERKYSHLLDQQYSPCPHCNRQIKAKPEKVKRKIKTMV